jgi:hypothetical protein
MHQPELWVAGHWHKSIDSNHEVEGKITRFKVLAELETFEVEL